MCVFMWIDRGTDGSMNLGDDACDEKGVENLLPTSCKNAFHILIRIKLLLALPELPSLDITKSRFSSHH